MLGDDFARRHMLKHYLRQSFVQVERPCGDGERYTLHTLDNTVHVKK